MAKKIVYYCVGAIIFLLIFLVLIFFFAGKDSSNGTSISTNSVKQIIPTEKQKYADFEAEFACQILGITDDTQMMSILSGFNALASKYGFTSEQVQQNVLKYQNDLEFKQLAFNSMKEQCPAKVQAAGISEFVPQQK